jgi:ribose-phosphate pyrophosphokinase
MMDKTRGGADEVEEMVIIGDVKGKNVIVIDDMTGTASTLCMASKMLKEAGAKSIRAVVSHGVLSGKAYENIVDSELTELVVSDSLDTKQSSMIKVISIAKQLSLAIGAINSHSSYEGLKKEIF